MSTTREPITTLATPDPPAIQHNNQDIEHSESALYPLTDADHAEAEQAQVRG